MYMTMPPFASSWNPGLSPTEYLLGSLWMKNPSAWSLSVREWLYVGSARTHRATSRWTQVGGKPSFPQVVPRTGAWLPTYSFAIGLEEAHRFL